MQWLPFHLRLYVFFEERYIYCSRYVRYIVRVLRCAVTFWFRQQTFILP